MKPPPLSSSKNRLDLPKFIARRLDTHQRMGKPLIQRSATPSFNPRHFFKNRKILTNCDNNRDRGGNTKPSPPPQMRPPCVALRNGSSCKRTTLMVGLLAFLFGAWERNWWWGVGFLGRRWVRFYSWRVGDLNQAGTRRNPITQSRIGELDNVCSSTPTKLRSPSSSTVFFQRFPQVSHQIYSRYPAFA